MTTATEGATGLDGRRTAVQALLDVRAAALHHKDEAGWLSPLDPTLPGLLRTAAVTWAALTRLPLARWSWQVKDVVPAREVTGSEREWVVSASGAEASAALVRVRLSYRLAGSDGHDVVREQALLVVQRAGGERVRAWRPVAAPDLWDLGEVDVVPGRRNLVLVQRTADAPAPQAAALSAWSRLAEAAVSRVDAVWGTGWSRSPVIEVPADEAALAVLLGRPADDRAGLDSLAAVTADCPQGWPAVRRARCGSW